MFRAIFFQALGEYTRFRRLIPWIVVALFASLIGFAWATVSKEGSATDRYSLVSYMLVYRIIALAAAFYATANVSAELDQRTIVYLLTRPVPRWKLIVARYLAAVSVVSLIGVFTTLVVAFIVTTGHPMEIPFLGKDVLAMILAAFAYSGAFLAVTVIFPSRAMIICMLYVFGWEWLVPNMPGTMYELSIFSHLQAVAQHPIPVDANKLLAFLASVTGTNAAVPESIAVPVLILIPIVSVVVAALWFTQFEFVPREDGE